MKMTAGIRFLALSLIAALLTVFPAGLRADLILNESTLSGKPTIYNHPDSGSTSFDSGLLEAGETLLRDPGDSGTWSVLAELNTPVITAVSYLQENGRRIAGAVRPLTEINIEVNNATYWEKRKIGFFREDCEEPLETVSLEEDGGPLRGKGVLALTLDGYFISSTDSYYLAPYCEWSRQYRDFFPIEFHQQPYVEEVMESTVWIPSDRSLGSYSCQAPLDMSAPVQGLGDRAVIVVGGEDPNGYPAKLARLHTVTGIRTEVVTTDEIYDLTGESGPAAIKDFLIDYYFDAQACSRNFYQYQPIHVVLYGNHSVSETVPSLRDLPAMRVYDKEMKDKIKDDPNYEFVSGVYYSDNYYADISTWDSNGDGVHNEIANDNPVGGYARLGVSRIPYWNSINNGLYLEKVIHHLTAANQDHNRQVLFLSNIARDFWWGSIDSARWLEIYTKKRLPDHWTITKLYEGNSPDRWDAQELTVDRQREELEKSPNLAIHMGHAFDRTLSCNYDGGNIFQSSDAYDLENPGPYSIFVSGGCRAGNLTVPRNAGTNYIMAPRGGGIAYIGNSSFSFGIKGSCQFIDQVAESFSTWRENRYDYPLSYLFLRSLNNFPDGDHLIDNTTWMGEWGEQYTKKSVVLLGDGLIPVHTWRRQPAPELSVTKTRYLNVSTIPKFEGVEIAASRDGHSESSPPESRTYVSRFEITVSPDYSGGVVRLHTEEGEYYEAVTNGSGEASLIIAGDPKKVSVGYRSSRSLYAYKEIYYHDTLLGEKQVNEGAFPEA